MPLTEFKKRGKRQLAAKASGTILHLKQSLGCVSANDG
jgi:hypothetical protein